MTASYSTFVSTCTRFAVQSFFFLAPATPEIYTLSLHDALPICPLLDDPERARHDRGRLPRLPVRRSTHDGRERLERSEEHTSELQSRFDLVCRLLLEKTNENFTELYTT